MMSRTKIQSLFDDTGAAVAFYEVGGCQVQTKTTKTHELRERAEGERWLHAALMFTLLTFIVYPNFWSLLI